MSLVAASAWVILLVGDPLTTRVQDAMTAAQALHGPLDGAWVMRDHRGLVIYTIEISDPPTRTAPAEGAWRDGTDRFGRADFLMTPSHRLRITLEGTALAKVDFIETAPISWRGNLPGIGAVTLTHGLATPRPPV